VFKTPGSEKPPNPKALAGYLVVKNSGSEERRLIAVASLAFERIELHRSVITEGMASMVPQDYMSVPAVGSLELNPGDYHLMLLHPAITLIAGDEVPGRLEFDTGNTLSVTMRVRKVSGEDHLNPPHDLY
jgi:periplasmic copper chaperone A